MRKFFVFILLLGVTGCTPAQHEAWFDWFDQDPDAALGFARDGCGDLGCSVDGQSSNDSDGWTDQTSTEDDSGVGVYWPWDELAACESGGNWHINTGNSYYGGIQFSLSSWQAAGGSGYPHENSPAEQVRRGEILQDMQGWGAWPSCARQIGLL